MANYNQKSANVKPEFNSPTFWLKESQTAAANAAAERAGASADAAPGVLDPPLTNRGDDKYRGNGAKVKRYKGLSADFIHGSSGVDFLCFGVYGKWRYEEILDTLQRAKNDGLESIKLFGVVCQLSPSGAREGVYYPFLLKWHGVQILISPTASGTIAPIRVHVSGLVLLQADWRVVVAAVFALLENWQFEIEYTTVSRVDLQVTFRGDFVRLAADVTSDRVVTDCRGDRVTYCNVHTMKPDTVWYRSNTLELCIYDKSVELQSNKVANDYKQTWARLYDLQEAGLCRVEFRLKSDALRRWGVRTLEELEDLMPSIVNRLTSTWFRVLKRPKVRGHENNAELSALWGQIRAAFSRVYDGSLKQLTPIKRQKTAHYKRLLSIARGCISSALTQAAEGARQTDFEAGYKSVIGDLLQGLPDKCKKQLFEYLQYST